MNDKFQTDWNNATANIQSDWNNAVANMQADWDCISL